MSNDQQVISYLSPAEMVALLNQTSIVTVHASGMSDGKPVIHATLQVMNSHTGENLPGGLPFSVVMFKGQNEPGYSNVAVGTIIPAAELNVSLPRDYFNFCNQRFRFVRVFPIDERAFVIQMDILLRDTTREHVKFSFGVWGALYSQILFELVGRGRESVIAAAEGYAGVHTDFATRIATAVDAGSDAVLPLAAEAIVDEGNAVAETAAAETPEPEAPAEPVAVEPVDEAPTAEVIAAADSSAEAEMTADPVEGQDESAAELSIVAGPTAAAMAEEAEAAPAEAEPAEAVVEETATEETATEEAAADEPAGEPAEDMAEARDAMPV